MKRSLTCALLAGALALAFTPSVADAKGKSKKAKRSKKATPTKTVKKAKKVKNYDFLADDIDGDRVKPDGTSIFGMPGVKHASLIRLRTEFIGEILKSAEQL